MLLRCRNFDAITPAEWLFMGCKFDKDFPFCEGEAAMELADILAWLAHDKPGMLYGVGIASHDDLFSCETGRFQQQ